jgi:2-isopropylmalate synthase
MEEEHGFRLPRKLQIEFSRAIQRTADETGLELSPAQLFDAFEREYLVDRGPHRLLGHRSESPDAEGSKVFARISTDGAVRELEGTGSGPIDAFVAALGTATGVELSISEYSEHALGEGADARAVAYVEVATRGRRTFGVGVHGNIVTASYRAVLGAMNRLVADGAVLAAE